MLGRIAKLLLGVVAGGCLLLVGGWMFLNTDGGRQWLSGHASRLSGYTVRLQGPLSLSASPAGLSVTDVVVAGEADPDAPWLQLEEATITLAELAWPPVDDNPLRLSVTGGELRLARLAEARPPADGEPPSLVLPPFAVDASVTGFRVQPLDHALPPVVIGDLLATLRPDAGLRLSGDALFDTEPLRVDADVALTEPVDGVAGARVTAEIDLAGLTVAASGDIADVMALHGIDVQLTAGGDIAERTGVGVAFTDQQVAGRLHGDLGALVFDVERLAGQTRNGAIALSGRLRQEQGRVVLERGNVDASADDLAAFLGDFGVESTLSMPMVLDADIAGDYDGASIDALVLSLDGEAHRIEGSARLHRDEAGAFSVEDGELSLASRDVSVLLTGLGADSSPLVGAARATASVRGSPQALSVDHLAVSLGEDAVSAVANGSLAMDGEGIRARLVVDATASATASVIPALPMPGWFGARGTASGTVAYADGRVSIEDLVAEFQGGEGTVNVRGDVDDLLAGAAPDLAISQRAANAEARGLRSLEATASLPGGLDQPATLSVSGATHLGEVSFEGTVESPRQRTGIEGAFVFTPREGMVRGVGPGAGGETVLEGRIHVLDVAQRTFRVEAGMRGGSGQLRYDGQLAEDFSGTGRFRVEGMNLNVLAALAGVETRFPNTAHADGTVRHGGDRIALSEVEFFTGATEINGTLVVVLPDDEGRPVAVDIDATSPDLALHDLGLEKTAGGASGEGGKGRYFSDAPLNLRSLNGLALDIVLDIERLRTSALDYHDVKLTGSGSGGVLDINSTQGLLGGRGSSLVMTIDARTPTPDVRLELLLDSINPGELRAADAGDGSYSGDIDVEMRLHGAGNSVSEILGNGNGYFLVRVNEAVLPNRKLNLLSADFLFETLRTVNPFVRQSKELVIECGIIGFIVRDGVAVADKSVVIRGQRLLIASEGEINLGNEQVAMVIRPKAQEGIGLNTSGLVKFIGIGGTLSEPQIRTDAKGLLMTGASIGAAVASGGMSLFLQNVFDRLTTGKGECERVETAFRERLSAGKEAERQVSDVQTERGNAFSGARN